MVFSRYQRGGPEDGAALVVHIAPERVLNTDLYKSWMERFACPHLHARGESSALEPSVWLLQVSILDGTSDPERTRVHGPQRPEPQDPDPAEHDPPGDLPAAPDLQNHGSWSKSREDEDSVSRDSLPQLTPRPDWSTFFVTKFYRETRRNPKSSFFLLSGTSGLPSCSQCPS